MPSSERKPSLEARLWNWGNASRGACDHADAMAVTRAWQRLDPRHRELLRMTYLWRVSREIVCRQMRIPRRPASLLELALADARDALAEVLAGEECSSSGSEGNEAKNF